VAARNPPLRIPVRDAGRHRVDKHGWPLGIRCGEFLYATLGFAAPDNMGGRAPNLPQRMPDLSAHLRRHDDGQDVNSATTARM